MDTVNKKLNGTEETNFMYFLKEVWRKKLIVALVAVVAAGLFTVYGVQQLPKAESGVPADGVYEAQTQVIIKDDGEKQIILDHKNNLAGLISSASAQADVISAFDLEMSETEFNDCLTLSAYGTNVLVVDLKIKEDPSVVTKALERLTATAIAQYQAVYPELEITQSAPHLVGDSYMKQLSSGEKVMSGVKYFAMGLFIGLAAVIAVIGIMVVFSNKINTESDIENCLELPVIASVRDASVKKSSNNEDIQRVAIFLAGRKDLKTVTFVSGHCREGKSHLVRNTAQALSLMGKKVLVVNTDYHKDSDAALLGTAVPAGTLAGLVAENASPAETITKAGAFSVLAAGASQIPFEVIASPRFDEMLTYAGENYDYVLLDTAEMNEYPEALLAAAKTDGAIYVAQARKVTCKHAETNVTQLRFNNVNLLGAVLNKVK